MEYSNLVAASRPEALLASLAANAEDLRHGGHGHHPEDRTSTRTETHNGHTIVIKTTYEITVDDQPFDAPLVVDNGGRVHYHGLPTRDFVSTVDLVKKVIDVFPGDFAAAANGTAGHDEHEGGR